MLVRMFFLIFCIYSFLFSQFTENNLNLSPYISDSNVGIGINPIITGLKNSIPNQETDINIVLFYQNKYLLKDKEILGVIEGRLISEYPLSSYDILEKIKKEEDQPILDYGKKFEEYQRALDEYRLFHKTFEKCEEEKNELSLHKNSLKLVAQNFSIENDDKEMYFPPFPEFNYINTSEKKELELLIQYEKLKKIYNEAVEEYNNKKHSDSKKYEDVFNPGDSSEFFTIMFMGQDDKSVWVKRFNLDGEKNYQSYNDIVWYLGYKINITKKDIRALFDVFSKNTKVDYIVKGSKGSVHFQLSTFFIVAVKELLELYVQGHLIIDPNIEYPIMRNE